MAQAESPRSPERGWQAESPRSLLPRASAWGHHFAAAPLRVVVIGCRLNRLEAEALEKEHSQDARLKAGAVIKPYEIVFHIRFCAEVSGNGGSDRDWVILL